MDNPIVACAVCLSTIKISPLPSHWLATLSLTVESAYACPLCSAALRRAAYTVRRVQHAQCALDMLRSTGRLSQENLEKACQESNLYTFAIHHFAPNHYNYQYNEESAIKLEPKDEIDNDYLDALSDASKDTIENSKENGKNMTVAIETWSEDKVPANNLKTRRIPKNKKLKRKKDNITITDYETQEVEIKADNGIDSCSDDSDAIPIKQLKIKAKNDLKNSKFKRNKSYKEKERKECSRKVRKLKSNKCENVTAISEFKKQRLEMDALLEKCFKKTKLTLAEMKEEVLKGKDSTNYKMSYFKCDICYRGFSESSVYERHKLRHTPMMGDHKCEICHWYVSQPRRHTLDRHAYRFRCRKCDVIIQNRTAALNHARHHEGKTYICDKCGKVFLHRSTHLSHLRIQHPTEHTCALCGFSFINEKGVRVHTTRVHPNTDTSIPEDGPTCVECDIKFKDYEALTVHEKVSPRHGEVKARNDPCRFHAADGHRIRNSSLPRKQRPREDAQTVYICEHCGKPIMGLQSYKSHVTSQHPSAAGAAPPPHRLCTVCGKTYKTLSLLRIHVESHNPRYECDVCHRKFTVARSLTVHMNLHTKDHEYPCDVCGKVFNNSGNRRRHLLTVHSEAKIQCSFCSKLFKSKPELGAHVKHVHLKVPYPKRERRRHAAHAAHAKAAGNV